MNSYTKKVFQFYFIGCLRTSNKIKHDSNGVQFFIITKVIIKIRSENNDPKGSHFIFFLIIFTKKKPAKRG